MLEISSTSILWNNLLHTLSLQTLRYAQSSPSTEVWHSIHVVLKHVALRAHIKHSVLNRRLDDLVEIRDRRHVEHDHTQRGGVQLDHIPACNTVDAYPVPRRGDVHDPMRLRHAGQWRAGRRQLKDLDDLQLGEVEDERAHSQVWPNGCAMQSLAPRPVACLFEWHATVKWREGGRRHETNTAIDG